MTSTRPRTLSGGVQHLLDYLKRMKAENPSFFYAVQNDGSDHSFGNSNVVWADAMSIVNYSYFGDAVILDTTYKTHRHRLPLASFLGFNHHGQPVLFGCALILNDSPSSFVWLTRTWLQAMSGRQPLSITTDPDPFIQAAVAQVLPQTRHRFPRWAIIRETRVKLAPFLQSHPTFESEFERCVNDSYTDDEFESSWASVLERYDALENEWLQFIYSFRHMWVPVYLRGTFFGDVCFNEGIENSSPFFDGYVNASTTAQMLPKQYEKAVSTWHEKELKADNDTINSTPILKTPSPMEKQAAGLYTRKIFMKFQEELVETLANPATKIDDSGTIATYHVAKFGEDHRAHTVTFDSFEMKAGCSCQFFEYSGIICRHILSVFRAKNVLKLPSQYILKRWTRNAKTGSLMDGRTSEMPNNNGISLTFRYNKLRQEAIKFVEEGAKSVQSYNAAMNALQEAVKQVTVVKNQIHGPALGTIANGDGGGLSATGEDRVPTSQLTEEKEKKIQELTTELESTHQRCEVYRTNLLAVLMDMEEQKLRLSVKVQNARLGMQE